MSSLRFSCTFSTGYEDHPVSCVTWGQARTFARWVGGDLPTEAQWEYAARGGRSYQYSGADDPDEVAWYSKNAGDLTHSVKQKQPNTYGLYDMSGNAREWVLDDPHNSYRTWIMLKIIQL